MGYRDLFLLLCGTVLMSLLMTQINRDLLYARENLQRIEIEQIAADVAQRFIEEGRTRKFDLYVGLSAPETFPGGFTPWYALGHAAHESYPGFNDIDDFNNFADSIYVSDIDFFVQIRVGYVRPYALERFVREETYLKRMSVVVRSSWLDYPVSVSQVFSYHGSAQ